MPVRILTAAQVCRALPMDLAIEGMKRAYQRLSMGQAVMPLRTLGEILAGRKRGRSSAGEITYFKSCGLAVQDAVAAGIVLRQAAAHNLGTMVDL